MLLILLALLGTTPASAEPLATPVLTEERAHEEGQALALPRLLHQIGAELVRNAARARCEYQERRMGYYGWQSWKPRPEGVTCPGMRFNQKGSIDQVWTVALGHGTARHRLIHERLEGRLHPRLTAAPSTHPPGELELSPFYPDKQSLYRFKLMEGDAGTVRLEFEPLQPGPGMLSGSAQVDTVTFTITSVSGSHTPAPEGLDRSEFEMSLAHSPCGNLPTSLRVVRTGGLPWFKRSYVTVIALSGHVASP